jgi:hypothetical protein
MTNQEIDQKHLALAMEMVNRQLSKFTLISLWDLHYTILRAITSQFFSHQRCLDSYVLTQAPGEPKFLITINGHATVRFEPKTEIVP